MITPYVFRTNGIYIDSELKNGVKVLEPCVCFPMLHYVGEKQKNYRKDLNELLNKYFGMELNF